MIRLQSAIDFHSHVLPEMDDGSASVDMSIAMLQMQAEQGITHVIATPHFYPSRDDPERFLDRRNRAEEKLRREMAKHSDLPEILQRQIIQNRLPIALLIQHADEILRVLCGDIQRDLCQIKIGANTAGGRQPQCIFDVF